MPMTIAGSPPNNGFLDTEEGLYTRNACFLKTFDTFDFSMEYYPIRDPRRRSNSIP